MEQGGSVSPLTVTFGYWGLIAQGELKNDINTSTSALLQHFVYVLVWLTAKNSCQLTKNLVWANYKIDQKCQNFCAPVHVVWDGPFLDPWFQW